ncbi:MAG: phosphatidylserine decarboxylase, partial [Helicobacteraceae bacterium]|nr:phosphatidylserine decarboxylase [Helicobacteraceae bacterium]
MRPRYISSALSCIFGYFASKTHPKKIQKLINHLYAKTMRLNMREFDSPSAYTSLNALFTRALNVPRQTPSDQNVAIAPCDSLITQTGAIEANTLFQIKNMPYSLSSLLAHKKEEDLKHFNGGFYANFYLSPRDYHRYHAPIALRLNRLTHIPGALLPVNMPFLRNKLNLFCQNERAVLEGTDTNNKQWILVFVGALNVGKMRFECMPNFQTNIGAKLIKEFRLHCDVNRGDLLGWFEMGSTVVLIAEKDAARFTILPNQKIKFGDPIAA